MAGRDGALAVGIGFAAVTTGAGALLPIITRYGATHIDPMLYCAGSAVVATICSLPLLGAGDGLGTLLNPRYRWRLMAISLAGTFVPSLCMVYGMRRVSAITGVLLLQTEPIYSLIVATLVVGEIPAPRQVIATGLILVGIFSAFWGAGSLQLTAPALMVALTPLMWQLSHVITLRVMPPLRPISVTAARNSHASLLLAALVFATNPSALGELGHLYVIGTLVVSGAVVYFLGTLTWYGAIKRLSLSWTTAVVVPGVPVLSLIFAAVFLGERAGMRQFVAIAVAVTGILGLVLGADPARRGATEIEAIEIPAPPGA
ncbi:MAG: DMT family transporter [Candidatus Binataceae bacterium]